MSAPTDTGTLASRRIVAHTEDELIAAVREVDAAGTPLRVVDGLDAPDVADFQGDLVQVATKGVSVENDVAVGEAPSECGGVGVTLAAGECWDDFVAMAVEREWAGVECLSGFAGTVGAAVVANLAAFGQSVGDTVAAVRTWDRVRGTARRLAMLDCDFDDEGSRFLRQRMPDGSGRYVVLDVSFLLRHGDLTDAIADADLARMVEVEVGERAPLARVREAVRTHRTFLGS